MTPEELLVQDKDAAAAIGASSYNNLVEKLVDLQCSGVDLDLTRIDSLRSRSGKDLSKPAVSKNENNGETFKERDLAAELASSLSAMALGSVHGARAYTEQGESEQPGPQESQAAGNGSQGVSGEESVEHAGETSAAGAVSQLALDGTEGKQGRGGEEEAVALAAAIQLSLGGAAEGAEPHPGKETESDEDGFVRISHPDLKEYEEVAEKGKKTAVEASEVSDTAPDSLGSSGPGAGVVRAGETATTGGEIDGPTSVELGESVAGILAASEAAADSVPKVGPKRPAETSELSVVTVLGSGKGKEIEQSSAQQTEPEAEVANNAFGDEASTSAEGAGTGASEAAEASDSEQKRRKVREGRAIQAFLESTASQLTYHGLVKLHEGIKVITRFLATFNASFLSFVTAGVSCFM